MQKEFSKDEEQAMNNELKEYMESNTTLIAVFGREAVLQHAAKEIYEKYGGVL